MMTDTNFYKTEIKGTMDVALARINLRKLLLSEVKCNVKTVARSTIALTALGELIMSTRPRSPISLIFSLTKTSGSPCLQFDCKFAGDFLGDAVFTRYRHNLEVVSDDLQVNVFDTSTEVCGYIRIV